MIISKDDFCGNIQTSYQSMQYVMDINDLVEAWPLLGTDLNVLLFDFENYESDADQEPGS